MLRDESFHPLEFDHRLFFNKDSKNPLPSSWITLNAYPIIERVSLQCSSFSSCLSCLSWFVLSCLSMFPFGPMVDEIPNSAPSPPESAPPPDAPGRKGSWLPPALFVLTLITTSAVGALEYGLAGGILYSTSLILILLCHEMGHYLTARHYAVPASLPYFIPSPLPPFGTFGAVIKMGGRIPTARPCLTSPSWDPPWVWFWRCLWLCWALPGPPLLLSIPCLPEKPFWALRSFFHV